MATASEIRLFLRFCVVGAIGFAVDAGILATTVALGCDPLFGRIISFSLAVLVTFMANRRWAFAHRSAASSAFSSEVETGSREDPKGRVSEYAIKQGVGAFPRFEETRKCSSAPMEWRSIVSEFGRYLTVQGTGVFLNFAIYAALVAFAADPFSRPIAALAIASAAALSFNFLGLRLAVFR